MVSDRQLFRFFLVIFLVASPLALSAQFELWEGDGERVDLNLVYAPWGGGLELEYGFLVPDLGQEGILRAGGGFFYRDIGLFRYPDTGELFEKDQFANPDDVDTAAWFGQLHNDAWLEYFQFLDSNFGLGVYLRQYWDYNLVSDAPNTELAKSSSFERQQIFLLSGTLYAQYDSTKMDELTKVRSGAMLLLGTEFSPVQDSTGGHTAYLKSSLLGQVYIPVESNINEELGRNEFSWYLAIRGIVDYTHGLLAGETHAGVPNTVRQQIGVRFPETALGGVVRGLESGRFDTPFKAVLNLDSRFLLPAIFDREIVPVALAFVDLGYYYDFGPGISDSSGFVGSAGLGLGLHLLSLVDLHLFTSLLLFDTNLRNEVWVPLSFGFTFHF